MAPKCLKKISNFVLGQRKAVHSALPLFNTLISFIIKKDVCNVFSRIRTRHDFVLIKKYHFMNYCVIF